MNQELRNKKNARYSANLAKRNGLTKEYTYLEQVDKGIKKSKLFKPLKHEFVLTKKNGQIVSKEVYIFEWSKEAKETKKVLASFKVLTKAKFIKAVVPTYTSNKRIKYKDIVTPSKEEYRDVFNKSKALSIINLENRKYSILHNKMISNTYSSENRYKRQMIEETKHNNIIKSIIEKLKSTKDSIRSNYLKKRPYSLTIVNENSLGQLYDLSTHYLSGKLNKISGLASDLRKRLSEKSDKFHHITIKDNHSTDKKVLMIFDNAIAA